MLIAAFCHETANVWRVLGLVVNVMKIIIPLILIVMGMVDLGKAVVSSDDKAINKSVTSLIKRFIAAVIVFFIPTIVNTLFNIVTGFDNEKDDDYSICFECVTDVNGDICDNANGIKK